MRRSTSVRLGTLVVLVLCSCTLPPTPVAPTPSTLPATVPAPATVTLTPGLPDTVRLRIRLSTTSDWTELSLVSGASWQTPNRISASEDATTAEIFGSILILDQPLARAEAKQQAEMVVEAVFSSYLSGGTVVFRITRGDIGSTQVEWLREIGGDWVPIRADGWDGVNGDGINALSLDISAEDLFSGNPSIATLPEPEPTPISPPGRLTLGTESYPWWNDTVFYEIFVRSFFDSDGDGIGDFNGITQKLDYLNDGDPETSADLGITGIWMMPIHPSPSYHGYSVTDYYAVNPDYGTMDDFRNLVAAAHTRGIRVIIDMVLNHTSNLHPWFEQAADPASPYHDWYVWSDTDPGYLGSWGQQVWFPLDGRFYYSTFSAGMPDLNYTNPAVTAEMENVVQFWLEDVGVDGFRLDAAKHLIEQGRTQVNTPSTHAWYKDFRYFYKQINPEAITVGEIWDTVGFTAKYVQGDELDLAFDFNLADALIRSVNEGNAERADSQLGQAYTAYPPLQFSPFLTNHDQNRVMTQLDGDPGKMKAAASLLLTAPGVPFLYYGEEIGMQGEKPDEQIRRPMPWSSELFAGFSTSSPWEPPGPGWKSANVAVESGDPTSLLSHYRDLIQARNQHAALRVGDLNILDSGNNALYSILRISQEEAVLVLVNLSPDPVTAYQLSLEESNLPAGTFSSRAILGEGTFAPVSVSSSGGFSGYIPVEEIAPFGTYIIRLDPGSP